MGNLRCGSNCCIAPNVPMERKSYFLIFYQPVAPNGTKIVVFASHRDGWSVEKIRYICIERRLNNETANIKRRKFMEIP